MCKNVPLFIREKGQEIKPIIMTKYQFENSSGSAQSSTVTKSPQHALYSTPRPMSSNIAREPPAREAPAASNATRELDDLMASLSDFKVCFHKILGTKPSIRRAREH